LLLGWLWWGRAFALLFLIGNTPGLGLEIPNFPKIEPNSPGTEGVRLRLPAVLLVGRPETPDESVQASPGLPERASAGRRRVGVPEERALGHVNLGLPELVQVAQKFQHMRSTTLGQCQWGPVVLQILPERVPVPAFLRLVAAHGRRCRRPRRRRGLHHATPRSRRRRRSIHNSRCHLLLLLLLHLRGSCSTH